MKSNPRSAKLAKKPVPSGGKKDSKSANPLLKTKRLSDNQLLGINLLTRQIIAEQIRILVAEDLQYLEVERERRKEAERTLKLEQEKQKKIEDFHSKISFYLNFYFIIAILMILSGLGGLLIGFNVPPTLDCGSNYLCQTLRIRN